MDRYDNYATLRQPVIVSSTNTCKCTLTFFGRVAHSDVGATQFLVVQPERLLLRRRRVALVVRSLAWCVVKTVKRLSSAVLALSAAGTLTSCNDSPGKTTTMIPRSTVIQAFRSETGMAPLVASKPPRLSKLLLADTLEPTPTLGRKLGRFAVLVWSKRISPDHWGTTSPDAEGVLLAEEFPRTTDRGPAVGRVEAVRCKCRASFGGHPSGLSTSAGVSSIEYLPELRTEVTRTNPRERRAAAEFCPL